MPPLILASASPRRRELLATLQIPFKVSVSDAPETIDPALSPTDQAITLAERKARAVAAAHADSLVLGADTLVVLNGEILGKPADDLDAARMLRRLSGREHLVITGVVLLDGPTRSTHKSAVTSRVRFRNLTDDEIADYIATGEPRDKAGAYAIQGAAGAFLAALDGCFNNVVGLPLCAVAGLLERAGATPPETFAGCLLPGGTPCPTRV